MDKRWTAKWVTDPAFASLQPINLYHKEAETKPAPDHKEELKNRHMLVRKTFTLNGQPGDAVLDITGDDYYKVYVNGQFVGQGPAQGGYFHYYYNRFDVTPYLRKGDNVIAVHVYYQGHVCRAYNSADYRQGLIAELTVDGVTAIRTDRSWLYRITEAYSSAGIIGYDTQYLENVDNRLKENGWREQSYDDSGWAPLHELLSDDHKLFLQPTPPLAVYELRPAVVKPLPAGGLWIDFGTELTGQLRLKASGKPGAKVEIRCGEELAEGGRVRFEMRCNCTYKETWTLSGADGEEPEFYDYKAFRYAEVLPEPGAAIDVDSIAAVVRHYPLDEQACRFESDDATLNAIWAICANGVKFGSQENYVDCPSREKGQYLGDNTVITHSHAYLSGDLRLYRKSLQDFALASSRVCPGVMAVAPGHHMQEIADFSFQWPMQLLTYYKMSGDIEFVREMFPVAERMLAHFDAFQREDGLLANVKDKWNLVDWPENLRDGYDFPLTRPVGDGCHAVLNAFYYGAVQAVAELRRLTGGEHGGRQPELERLPDLKAAFVQAFYRPDSMLFADSERSNHSSLHANVLPLLFGLEPEEAKPSIVGLIRKKKLCCGVYFAYFVLQSLVKAGEYNLAYELIRSEELHSWGNMVKEGATTCFEAWGKDLKWNTSLCHPWASAPVPLLIEHIIGIQPAEPGWTKVRFEPHLPDSLDSLKLEFRVPTGVVRFELKDGQTNLTVPEGVAVL